MNMPRKTLGRGLGDLMSEVARIETPLATASDRGFLQLPLESLADTTDPATGPSADLVESIRTHGVLQPILARKIDSGYEVIDGRQRLHAARTLGLKAIPALILNKPEADVALLAAEANRHNPPPAPMPVPAPAPSGWRLDWRLPAALATIALLALLLGMGLARLISPSSGWTPVSLPASDRAEDNTVQLDEPSIPDETAANELTTPPVIEAPPPSPTAWAASLSIEGVQVTTTGNTTTLTFVEPVFSHHTTLSPQAGAVLRQAAAALVQTEPSLVIQVRGHTDDTPMRGGGPYRDNYALGLARATRVVQFLRYDVGLTNAILSATSQGDEAPPFPNDTPAGRLKNRTVSLTITAE
jgi:flagellar motor protein MotB